jgi:hypothetical protein
VCCHFLIIRRDNDRRRDLTPREIVTAIGHRLATPAKDARYQEVLK